MRLLLIFLCFAPTCFAQTGPTVLTQRVGADLLGSPCIFQKPTADHPGGISVNSYPEKPGSGTATLFSPSGDVTVALQDGFEHPRLSRYVICWKETDENGSSTHILWEDRIIERDIKDLFHAVLRGDSAQVEHIQRFWDKEMWDQWRSQPVWIGDQFVTQFIDKSWKVHILTYKDETWTSYNTGINSRSGSLFTLNDQKLCLMYVFPVPLDEVPPATSPRGWFDWNFGSPYLACSPDAGKTWETPRLITYLETKKIGVVSVTVGPDDVIHAVLDVSDESYPSGTYFEYITSTDGGISWSDPEVFEQPEHVQGEHLYDPKLILNAQGYLHLFTSIPNYIDDKIHIFHFHQVPDGGWSEGKLLTGHDYDGENLYHFDVNRSASGDAAHFVWTRVETDSTGQRTTYAVMHTEPLLVHE